MVIVVESQSNALSGHETNDTKPTVAEADWAHLRRVPDKLPKVALLILAVEVRNIHPQIHPISAEKTYLTSRQLGERFTYFGLSGPIQNYIKYVCTK